jgi:hypothetical protein
VLHFKGDYSDLKCDSPLPPFPVETKSVLSTFITVGNQCRNILHHLDQLEEELQGQHPQWISAFRAFLRMTKACYGRDLSDNYVETIADFQDKYLNLGINVTPKVILKQMLHHFQRS